MLKRILASDAIVSSLYRRRKRKDLLEKLKQGRPRMGAVHLNHKLITKPVKQK
jgi:hypothetical protein